MAGSSNPTPTADKDYFATDDEKVVGPRHPARRRLIALQGTTIPEPFARTYKVPREYDHVEVPEPSAPTAPVAAAVAPSGNYVELPAGKTLTDVIAEQVAAALAAGQAAAPAQAGGTGAPGAPAADNKPPK